MTRPLPNSARTTGSFIDEARHQRSMARYCMQHGWRRDAKEWLRAARAAEKNARGAA